jgi:hypothetical protein
MRQASEDAMTTHSLLITMTNPVAGREEEYRDWYANTHIVEMVQAPKVLTARLHDVTDARTPTRWRHCALYELEGDPAEAMQAVFESGKTANRSVSTAGDTPSRMLALATPITERLGDAPADPDNHVFLVLTNPTPGMEDEYNRWYNDQHAPDVLAIDGFVGVQRFKLAAVPGMDAPYWGYVAFYEIDRNKVAQAFKGLEEARDTPRMVMSEALHRPDNEVAVYAPVAAAVKAEAVAAK